MKDIKTSCNEEFEMIKLSKIKMNIFLIKK